MRAVYKTVRTVKRRISDVEELNISPKFSIGQWVEIYHGMYEGHEFTIRDIRYNHDRQRFEYLYEFVGDHWYGEGQLI